MKYIIRQENNMFTDKELSKEEFWTIIKSLQRLGFKIYQVHSCETYFKFGGVVGSVVKDLNKINLFTVR